MVKHIHVDSDNIRALKSPHDPKVRSVYAYVALAEVPNDLPLSPNPRVPKPNEVIKRVEASLQSDDGIFHILNRGITVSARTADYDNSSQILSVDIPDGEEYGILDGGHTYDVVKRYVGHPPKAETQFIKFEILTGVEPILPSIASARNFSKAVKDISLANYSHKLDWLKVALGEISDRVRWRENDEQPFDVIEYIQVIAAFDINNYSDSNHPLRSYKSSGECLSAAIDDSLKYLTPIARDIVVLYDTMRFNWWPFYTEPDENGKGGRPGKLREVTARKRGTSRLLQFPSLPDVDSSDAKYHVEKGLVIPLIAAFRGLLSRDESGGICWKTDPFSFWKNHGPELVRKVMDASDQRSSNPQIVGRDKTVYEALYESVENRLLKGQ